MQIHKPRYQDGGLSPWKTAKKFTFQSEESPVKKNSKISCLTARPHHKRFFSFSKQNKAPISTRRPVNESFSNKPWKFLEKTVNCKRPLQLQNKVLEQYQELQIKNFLVEGGLQNIQTRTYFRTSFMIKHKLHPPKQNLFKQKTIRLKLLA